MIARDQQVIRMNDALSQADHLFEDGRNCPDSEEIWDAVNGQIQPRRVRKIVDHTLVCGVCAHTWSIAHEANKAEHEASHQGATVVAFPGRFKKVLGFAPLVAAAILILMFGLPKINPEAQEAIVRGGESSMLEALYPTSGELSREDCRLKWTMVEDVDANTRYSVRVTTSDLFEVVAEARELEIPEYQIPTGRLKDLKPGEQLIWMVKAVTEDGQEYSQTFTYRLK